MARVVIGFLVAILIGGCGGGGGGGSPFYGGVWRGGVGVLVSNDCPSDADFSATQDLAFPHTVNQLDSEVNLTDADGVFWDGRVNDIGGFSVLASPFQFPFGSLGLATIQPALIYSEISGNSGLASFAIDILFRASTGQSARCLVVYQARVSRL